MQHDDAVYLAHMLETARRVRLRVQEHGRAGFEASEDLRLALTHLIQTVGEAARQVSDETRSRLTGIPGQQVIGMRHILVHNYLGVDEDIVWQVASRDIPSLIECLEKAE